MIYKRQLLMGYMVFNAALYAGQLILYLLLFLPSFSKASGCATAYITRRLASQKLTMIALDLVCRGRGL